MHLQQAFATYKLNPDSVKKIFCQNIFSLVQNMQWNLKVSQTTKEYHFIINRPEKQSSAILPDHLLTTVVICVAGCSPVTVSFDCEDIRMYRLANLICDC